MTATSRKGKPSPPTNPTPAPEARRTRTDWDAVERDHRTAHFTLRELGEKHGIDHSSISRRIRKDREKNPDAWSQDLRAAVKAATSAKLIQESVTKEVTSAHQSVTNTVLAAAETNKNVILGHRSDINRLRDLTMGMAGELSAVSLNQPALDEFFTSTIRAQCETPEAIMQATRQYMDLVKLPSRILGAKSLAEALTKLQTIERKAFGLDEETGDEGAVVTLTDAERASRLASLLRKARTAKAQSEVGDA